MIGPVQILQKNSFLQERIFGNIFVQKMFSLF